MEEINVEKDQNIDYKDCYLRAIADYQNLKKNIAKKQKMNNDNMVFFAVDNFLPLIDNIERGANSGNEEMKLLFKQSMEIFDRLNVERIDQTGIQFDDNIHNALSTINMGGTYQDNEVISIQRAGYKYNDQIIRYADVIVNKY